MKKSLVVGGIIMLIMLVATMLTINIETVKGGEVGVKETWSDGVIDEALTPKTYILIPGFSQKIYKYSVEQQVFVMNDRDDGTEFAEGRYGDSYLVQSSEGQDMHISLSVQWRRDPLKVVELHKVAGKNVEERILRPEVMRIVKDAATTRTGLEAYSGQGLVALQTEIQGKLQSTTGELRTRGIIVDNFVVEHIKLDDKYVNEIKERQVAVQARLRAIEQTKAAEANADKAKAEAQADYERQMVEALRDKDRGILEAEKKAQQQILAAKAQAEQIELAANAERMKRVLEAQGEKEAGILRAESILALGEAEAEAIKLKMQAYSADGSDAYVKMQVAESLKGAYSGIKGYLPQDMNVTVLTDQFEKSVSILATPEK